MINELLLKEREYASGFKDFKVKKFHINPSVCQDTGRTYLSVGEDTTDGMPLNKTGMASYLDKISVPRGFFAKCSVDLKQGIVSEFQAQVPNSGDKWFVRSNRGQIRYVASDQYAKFDNLDILEALAKVNLDGIEQKEYHDNGEHFVLRLAQKEPLMMGGRPFFAGLQLSNSEVGLGSVRGSLMLWEEVCTNGLTVPVKDLGTFSMIHAGQNRRERLDGSLFNLIEKFDTFVERSGSKLADALTKDGVAVLKKVKRTRAVSETLYHAVEEKLKNYAEDVKQPLYLDVVSAYTEAIQTLPWEERFYHERLAGSLLWDQKEED